MWRFHVPLLVVFGWTAFAGCQGQSQPEPLTPEQEREMQRRIEQTQEEERAHFAREDPNTGTGGR